MYLRRSVRRKALSGPGAQKMDTVLRICIVTKAGHLANRLMDSERHAVKTTSARIVFTAPWTIRPAGSPEATVLPASRTHTARRVFTAIPHWCLPTTTVAFLPASTDGAVPTVRHVHRAMSARVRSCQPVLRNEPQSSPRRGRVRPFPSTSHSVHSTCGPHP